MAACVMQARGFGRASDPGLTWETNTASGVYHAGEISSVIAAQWAEGSRTSCNGNTAGKTRNGWRARLRGLGIRLETRRHIYLCTSVKYPA